MNHDALRLGVDINERWDTSVQNSWERTTRFTSLTPTPSEVDLPPTRHHGNPASARVGLRARSPERSLLGTSQCMSSRDPGLSVDEKRARCSTTERALSQNAIFVNAAAPRGPVVTETMTN